MGRVGTNFIFWVPALVVSAGILARLAIAFPGFDGPGVPDIVLRVVVSCKTLKEGHEHVIKRCIFHLFLCLVWWLMTAHGC